MCHCPGRLVSCALVVAALTFAFPQHGFAQITSATLSGDVKDETGSVLPGAAVEAKNLDTASIRATVTDGNGRFTIPGLPPGPYEVHASLAGFAKVVQGGITLAVGQEAGLTLVLKVGGTADVITVTGGASLVDTRSASLSAVVNEQTIEQLPLNGRNYIDLALLQPGVTSFNEKDSSSSSNRGTKLNINGMGFARTAISWTAPIFAAMPERRRSQLPRRRWA